MRERVLMERVSNFYSVGAMIPVHTRTHNYVDIALLHYCKDMDTHTYAHTHRLNLAYS